MNCERCSKKKKLCKTTVFYKNEYKDALLCTSCGATTIIEKDTKC